MSKEPAPSMNEHMWRGTGQTPVCVNCGQMLKDASKSCIEPPRSMTPEERARDMVWHFAEGGLRRDQLTDAIMRAIREAIAAEREAITSMDWDAHEAWRPDEIVAAIRARK